MITKSKYSFMRILSVCLAIVVLFTVAQYMPTVADEELQTEAQMTDLSNIVFLSQEEINSQGFLTRLTGKEDLNSYVFLNSDGTETAYIFPNNIKFIDESGKIVEKDTTLVKNKNGGFTVKASDYGLYLPEEIGEGYLLSYGGKNVKITPKGTSSKGVQIDNSIIYTDVFEEGILLKYTPTLTGIKEDIVLSQYTGHNTFAFIMEAKDVYPILKDGMLLLCDNNGNEIFHFKKIYVYDAVGNFTIGEITVTNTNLQECYEVSVSVSREFLSSPDTVYPVTIDPSTDIYENSDGSFIQDAPVFANLPDDNFGSNMFNTVGTISNYYGEARTAMKLYGLSKNSIYKTLDADEIESVEIIVDEATGASTSLFINLYRISNAVSWNENTVKWNNVGSYDTSYNAGRNLSAGSDFAFNITKFVKGWKNYSYPQSMSVLFISSSSSVGTFRQFYASDSTETSGNRPYIKMRYNLKSLMDEGIYYIKSKQLDKYVQPVGGLSSGVNAYIELRDFSGNDAQKWIVKSVEDGFYTIENVATGYVLTVPNGQRAENVRLKQMANSSSDALGQRWRIYMTTYCGFAIKPKSAVYSTESTLSWSEYVMSVNDGNDGNGAQVAQRSYAYNESFKDEWYLVPTTITSGSDYYIVNKQLETNARPQGASVGTNRTIELWARDTSSSQKWVFTRQSNGFYKISPLNYSSYALTIASGNESAENGVVRLESYSSTNARQQWLIYKVPNGYVLKAKSSGTANLVLSVSEGNLGNGATVSQRAYVNNLSYKEEWHVTKGVINLDVVYDNAYATRFSNSNVRISNMVNTLRSKYANEFNIQILRGNSQLFNSYADESCSSSYTAICPHATSEDCQNSKIYVSGSVELKDMHHTNLYNIMARIPFPAAHTAKVVFTGHKVCCNVSAVHREHPYYGLTFTTNRLISVMNFTSTGSEQKTLVHEFGHLFKAPDHYGGSTETTAEIIARTGDAGFSSNCIYGENKDTALVIGNLTICDGCRAFIEANRNLYN